MRSTVPVMHVAVLGIDGMLDSGLSSVLDVFTSANALHRDAGLATAPFEVSVTAQGHSVRTAHGLTAPTTPWARVLADPPDLLVMPSIGVRPPAEVVDVVRHHPALDGVRELHGRGTAVAASCSGTFFLAEAGVLDGLRATTSWWLAETFRDRYPRVALEDGHVVVDDGGVMTAAAGFAAIDLGLALVARTSPALAELTGAYVVAGQRTQQVGVVRANTRAAAHPLLVAFERHVREHLAAAPTMAQTAAAIGSSERHLQRLTAEELGMTPGEWVQELRVERAVHLLTSTDRSTAAVARAVGYGSADALRAVLRRRRSVSVTELRGER